MITSALRLPTLLRASLLALLVLGIVIKPVLSAAFELHAFDHAVSTHVDDHGHDQAGADDREASGLDDQPGQGEAQGLHSLLHEGNYSGAYTDSIVVLSLPVVPYDAMAIPLPDASPVSLQHLTGPFRPPIA